MQQKTNSSVANFLPLWPDEMTKGCTAQDFVPRGEKKKKEEEEEEEEEARACWTEYQLPWRTKAHQLAEKCHLAALNDDPETMQCPIIYCAQIGP